MQGREGWLRLLGPLPEDAHESDRQHRDIESINGGESASYLIYVHLDAAEIGQVARAHHQDAQGGKGESSLCPHKRGMPECGSFAPKH